MFDVDRREFLALVVGAAVASPLAAQAQRVGGIATVGILMAGAESAPDNQKRIAAFRQAFAELGWKDGDNVRIAYRWSAGSNDLIRQYAKELVALAPDVILANSTPVISELKNVTTTIPVVFALAIDPVGLGHVQSLSHPGGNFTGFTFINPELIGKWMELLKEVKPDITQAAVLFDPDTSPFYDRFVRAINAARAPGAIELVAMPVGSASDMEAGIKAIAARPGSGVLFGPDPFNQVHLKQIAQLAGQNRLPTISVYRPFVVERGLMAYGPDTADVFRRAAAYVDRVLKGARPADLPVQQPIKFELIINLRAAKALEIEVPPLLLARADEVIE
jgi:putative tryptophan/tyrosine transport system substrate-binding protein